MQITQDFRVSCAALARSYHFNYGAGSVSAAAATLSLYLLNASDSPNTVYIEDFAASAVDSVTFASVPLTFGFVSYNRHTVAVASILPATNLFVNKSTKVSGNFATVYTAAPTGNVIANNGPAIINGTNSGNLIVLKAGDCLQVAVNLPATTNIKNFMFSANCFI